MKEILKYLRTVNSLSQKDVAEKLGLSRQSYNKYEAGSVVPSDKTVKKLAGLYDVSVEFIKANIVPKIQDNSYYNIDRIPDETLYVSDPAVAIKNNETQIIIKIHTESKEEKKARKQNAFKNFIQLAQKLHIPENLRNLNYDELTQLRLKEEHGIN